MLESTRFQVSIVLKPSHPIDIPTKMSNFIPHCSLSERFNWSARIHLTKRWTEHGYDKSAIFVAIDTVPFVW